MEKITMTQARNTDYCNGYNDAIDHMNQHMMHPIICKNEREAFPKQITIGNMYYLYQDSVLIIDGEVYGYIYEKTDNEFCRIAFMKLSHFASCIISEK